MKNLTVKNCQIQHVAHTGIKFTASDDPMYDVKVYGNRVLNTGGPGMQASRVQFGHFHHNYVQFSGSPDDSRKWGRGSGFWTWGANNVIIEYNHFLNANGPGDSAGCHIDFNSKNVIVQYNFSANNAGGFCEILGNNYNCAYRYNISVNDGHRVKGENGAFQEGKTFWLSGYNGNGKKRTGPFNSYFYNNTIYVSKDIQSKIAIDRAAKGMLIANNIFYIEGDCEVVKGDQYVGATEGDWEVENVVFSNNLFTTTTTWPEALPIKDEHPFFGNPAFLKEGGISQVEDYIPTAMDKIKNRGMEISKINLDALGLFTGLQVTHDILGNPIKGLPDIGAIEIE